MNQSTAVANNIKILKIEEIVATRNGDKVYKFED